MTSEKGVPEKRHSFLFFFRRKLRRFLQDRGLRRVQGRPQSPWNKGHDSLVLSDKYAPKEKFFKRVSRGLCGRPLDPFAPPSDEEKIYCK
jgi:hypothetical protein